MSDETPEANTKPKRRRGLLLPLLLGAALAAGGGGAGYWAVTAGPFAADSGGVGDADAAAGDGPRAAPQDAPTPDAEVAFVPLETLVISLGPEETARHLMFTAELEVDPAHETEVARLSPRVLDVLNSYLRVISVSELGDPASLGVLRAQMLRRIQVVTGAGRVRDLLVTQFVVN
jgi:flagellar FliL protein